jgi:phosphatidylserine/phosphatidylglycerophosphate/cardiolipin synthase-like enzyme
MTYVQASVGATSVRAYRGDRKTLLAFDITTKAARQRLAGFTIQVSPPGVEPYYLLNSLRFESPTDHAQDPSEPVNSSVNAPFHKFRWLHVPGSAHQGLDPAVGQYTYTITPRYFNSQKSLLPLDATKSVSVKIEVNSFVKGALSVAFTRGFTQSQAFVRHFGRHAPIRPHTDELLFDTSDFATTNAQGESWTYAREYEWLGFTTREQIFELLDEVQADKKLRIDVFAYDLNEPDFMKKLLSLAKEKRVRIILDNAALHHNADKPKPEDQFAQLLATAAGDGAIKRGHFSRYAHDKVIIVSDAKGPKKVLTGSTNFSVTGLYVNSNHVLVFDDRKVAATYQAVFDKVWEIDVHKAAFVASNLSTGPATFDGQVPKTSITFAPHSEDDATQILDAIVTRVQSESTEPDDARRSVMFAVMDLGGDTNPVGTALRNLHEDTSLFTYGISDGQDGITLYPVGSSTGVLVTGKPTRTKLPPPFNQVPGVGLGHQVHHKFVVCGFNGPDPVVYCGSSNLALGGEQVNGDNLLEIHDEDVATVFAIEALGLIDHFNFLDNFAERNPAAMPAGALALQPGAPAKIGWFLGTTDAWVTKYFDPNDLHSLDRELFS